MTTADDRGPALEWTGERYVPQVSGNIRLEHLHRYLLARELSKGKRVLDIACGEGYGSDLLAEVAESVVGVDIAGEVVRHARVRYRRPNLAFAAGDCAAIPLVDRSIDVVVSFETLEHHDRHAEMMQEVKRVLRPGGLLIISSPDRHEYSEVPEYQNPYHAHELDRSEFARLLESHFSQVRLVGQRIRAGSIVGPLSAHEDSAFISFAETEDGLTRVDGVQAPLYFIGLASDGKMPQIPAGILDGGEFLWSTDHVAAFAAAVASNEKQTESVRTVLQEEIARRGQRIDDLERSRHELQVLTNDAHAHLEDARSQLGEMHVQIGGIASRLRQREAEVRALDGQLAEQRTAAAASATTIGDLKQARDALSAQLSMMEGSHSWTLTAPLRASRRLAGRSAALSRKLISDTARTAYREFPLTAVAKRRIKAAVFRTAPWLVRHTEAYKAWQRQSTAITPESPPVQHAHGLPRGTEDAVGHSAAPLRRFHDAVVDYVPLRNAPAADTRIKAIAFYLPQFHPIPENDTWWGKGFTEWNNVARGKPQFAGHYQPHLPGELGFYDLRLMDVQRRQIELAKAYGLHGFCYHHYWFGGKRLLRRPLDQLLANPDLDFPFCLCWANENWTRRWDGLDSEVLIAQQHSPEDDLAFIRDIEPTLRETTATSASADARCWSSTGRVCCQTRRRRPSAGAAYRRSAGLSDLFLVSAQAFDRANPRDFGFDAAMEFAPNNMGAPRITDDVTGVNPDFAGTIYDYSVSGRAQPRLRAADGLRALPQRHADVGQRARGGRAVAPSSQIRRRLLYREWLENACRYTDAVARTRKAVRLHQRVERVGGRCASRAGPRYGYAYLQATADALRKFPVNRPVDRGRLARRVFPRRAAVGARADDDSLAVARVRRRDPAVRRWAAHEPSSQRSGASTSSPRQRPRSKPGSDIASDLFNRGARIALCNTSVVGDTVELLKRAGFTVVSMIHELPGLIGQYGLETSISSIARHADRVVFPARIVRDPFIELTGMPLEKAVVRPQGLLAPNRFANERETARREVRTLLGLPEDATIVLAWALPIGERASICSSRPASLSSSGGPTSSSCGWDTTTPMLSPRPRRGWPSRAMRRVSSSPAWSRIRTSFSPAPMST